jgi:hypothetical protein
MGANFSDSSKRLSNAIFPSSNERTLTVHQPMTSLSQELSNPAADKRPATSTVYVFGTPPQTSPDVNLRSHYYVPPTIPSHCKSNF